MAYELVFILLWGLLFAWILYFYGTEERMEKFRKLQEGNMVIGAVDMGVILGMCTIGFISMILLLT